jgi:glycosyltransferase involved in cell wall biosynthesis
MDPPRIGGAERYFGDLASGLADAALDVHVIMPDGVLPPYMRDRVGDRVPMHVIGPRPEYDKRFGRNAIRIARPAVEVRAAMRRVAPDVVHLCNGGFPGSHTCRAAALVARGARVMTVNSRGQKRRLAVHAAHDRLIWRSLDRVITPSRATADALVEFRHAPSELLRVVRYGIDAPTVEPGAAEQLRAELAPNGELLVGMVVAPSADDQIVYKGHDVLVDAIAAAGRRDVRAAVVGHDPGPVWRERVESLGVSDGVTLIPGFRDAAPYMQAFDVLVVPSTRHEALPLVVLEAMASGKPVLASRLSGIPEAVLDGETGHTFEPGDAAALGRLIARYAGDREESRRLGDGGRDRWRTRFSLQRMVAETVAVYEECVDGGRRSPVT